MITMVGLELGGFEFETGIENFLSGLGRVVLPLLGPGWDYPGRWAPPGPRPAALAHCCIWMDEGGEGGGGDHNWWEALRLVLTTF